MTNLSEVRAFLSNIPKINEGGCVLSAVAMKRWLADKQGVDAQIVYGYERGPGDYYYENNSKALEAYDMGVEPTETEVTSCCHAGLMVQGLGIIDSDEEWIMDSDCDLGFEDEVYTSDYSFDEIMIMPEELAVESLNRDCWNSNFKRYRYLDMIQEVLGVDLSDINHRTY